MASEEAAAASYEHIVSRIAAIELLVSHTAAQDGRLDAHKAFAAMHATPAPSAAVAELSPAAPITTRIATLCEALSQITDEHPELQTALRHLRAHPHLFPSVAATAQPEEEAAAGALPAAILEPLLLESAEDVSASARALQSLDELVPAVLDAPAPAQLATLHAAAADAEARLVSLRAASAGVHASLETAADAYGAAVAGVSAQLVQWADALTRTERALDAMEAAARAGK